MCIHIIYYVHIRCELEKGFVANLKKDSNDISATFTKANAFAGFENSLSLDLSNDNSGETGSNLVM